MDALTSTDLGGSARILTIAAAVGAGVNGGVFFAFSTFVMPAIRTLQASEAIRAMQAINTAAPTPPFMAALFGTAAVTVALSVVALRNRDTMPVAEIVVGTGAFLLCIVLTAAYHVPHNDALAKVDSLGAGAAQTWARFASGWTAWNHLRTASCIVSATSFALALRRR